MAASGRIIFALFLLCAAFWDYRKRKIPNWLVLITLFAEFFSKWLNSPPQAYYFMIVFLTSMLLLSFPLYLTGAGGGDLKHFSLMIAVLGLNDGCIVLLITCLLTGLYIVFYSFKSKVNIRSVSVPMAVPAFAAYLIYLFASFMSISFVQH